MSVKVGAAADQATPRPAPRPRGEGTVHAGSLRASATQWNGTSRRNGTRVPSAMDPSVGSGFSNAVSARPADLGARKCHEGGPRPNPVGGIPHDGGHYP
jgi:hypothetical protein